MITVGSLFAGIGGLELGLERTGGFKTVWQVENDPYVIRVLEKHWPDVRRRGDVRTFPPRSYEFGYSWRGMPVGAFAPDVKRETTRDEWGCDLICGGFPCQDISNAGKRAGIDGERSGLWSEFARIIGVLRPRFVLVENVSALLIRGIDRVLGDLATLGYDAEWQIISAAAVGAPHIRERVFILAYPTSIGLTEAIFQNSTFKKWLPESDQWRGERPSMCKFRRDDCGWLRWIPHDSFIGVDNGVPGRLDEARGYGNAVPPQMTELIGRMILDSY